MKPELYEVRDKNESEFIDVLQDLELQYDFIRNQYYESKLMQVECALTEIEHGFSGKYISRLKNFEREMKVRIGVAEKLHCCKLTSINNMFEAENQAAKQDFENQKQLAKDYIQSKLINKINKMEDACERIKLKAKKRKKISILSELEPNPVSVSGPYIVYMLSKNQIREDLVKIRKISKLEI